MPLGLFWEFVDVPALHSQLSISAMNSVFLTTSTKQKFKDIQHSMLLFQYLYNMEIWFVYQGLWNFEAKTSFTEFKRGALLSISSSSGYKTNFILKIFSSFQLKFPLLVGRWQFFEGSRSRSKIDVLLPQKSVLQKQNMLYPFLVRGSFLRSQISPTLEIFALKKLCTLNLAMFSFSSSSKLRVVSYLWLKVHMDQSHIL